TARDGGVRGSLDDGPAVGEERQLVGIAPEFENELAVPHGAERGEAAGEFVEVNGPLPLMYLDGIPPAERDVRPSFAGQMDKVVGPYVVRQKRAPGLVAGADQQFDGFGGGNRGDKVHG